MVDQTTTERAGTHGIHRNISVARSFVKLPLIPHGRSYWYDFCWYT